MKRKSRIYTSFAKIIPYLYRNYINQLLVYGGEKKRNADDWLGAGNIIGIAGTITLFVISFLSFSGFSRALFLVYGILFFFAIHFIIFIFLHLKMEDRTRRIEEKLPDVLQLTATNIRSGMTPFRALKLSSKEEFGPLKEEIDYVTMRSLGTVNFSEVLLSINRRVKSEVLERSLRLFTNAMRTGGHLAQLLEDIARDIVETRTLKKELVTSTRTYTMFILFMVVVGTPLMLSVALSFLNNILAIQPSAPVTTIGSVGGIVNKIVIMPDFMFKMSIAMLIITSAMASILSGVIKEGSYVYGFRSAPFVTIMSLAAFFVINFLVKGFLG
jgi:pilus assembly protein TadC